MPTNGISRRTFIQSGLAATAALPGLAAIGCSQGGDNRAVMVQPSQRVFGANDRIRIAVIGTGGRGTSHIHDFVKRKDVELVGICDVDDAQLDKAAAAAAKFGAQPKRYKDFRQVLDQKDIDAVFVTTCCHWHAIPAIAAMKAGKDLYLEKPSGHTLHECKVIADTAKETKRIVQIGTQQRSVPHWQNAVSRIQAGEIGQVTTVHAWNAWGAKQLGGTMGKLPDGNPPASVDYDMWLGPAPKRPFNPNRFHFNFYFFFDYSTGMTIAWGVHLFDVVTWAMGPTVKTAAASGGIYVLKDDRDTPDTMQATIDCGSYVLDYSLRHTIEWPRHGKMDHGIEFVGTKGVLQINRGGFDMFREDARVTREPYYSEKNKGDDTARHQANFFDCVKSRKQTNTPAQAGYEAATPGLLSLISYRIGRSVKWDAKTGTIVGDKEAARLLTKEYRKPWHL